MRYLPTWFACDFKRNKTIPLTPLETFVYEHTPANREDEEPFRAHLLAALNEVHSEGTGLNELLYPAYAEHPDPIYGDLTPEQRSEYQDYEVRKNRGN